MSYLNDMTIQASPASDDIFYIVRPALGATGDFKITATALINGIFQYIADDSIDWAKVDKTGALPGDIGAAPAAEGVTNGNSHNHNGGDGGIISHDHLIGAGANNHAAIDDFIASKGVSNGVASLDGAGDVVQDPANATAVAGAGKIPIADGSGKLDTWITGSGVTGGDTHDHSSGDGAQINHGELSNIGTNTHAQIDTFIASKGAASGLASLDASGDVIQDPANATDTPAANKIPIADVSGTLDAWVSKPGVTGGDAHDHDGGDGAQIDHDTLSNNGTYDHTAIDTHIDGINPHSITPALIGASDSAHDHGAAGGVSVNHNNLLNNGTYLHSEIDTHIDDLNNPHKVGQNLTFNMSLKGVVDLGSTISMIGGITSVLTGQVATWSGNQPINGARVGINVTALTGSDNVTITGDSIGDDGVAVAGDTEVIAINAVAMYKTHKRWWQVTGITIGGSIIAIAYDVDSVGYTGTHNVMVLGYKVDMVTEGNDPKIRLRLRKVKNLLNHKYTLQSLEDVEILKNSVTDIARSGSRSYSPGYDIWLGGSFFQIEAMDLTTYFTDEYLVDGTNHEGLIFDVLGPGGVEIKDVDWITAQVFVREV